MQNRSVAAILNTLPAVLPVGSHGVLRALTTDRFKSGRLSLSFLLPLSPENATMAPLLLSVLRRGTEKYPTVAHSNRRLAALYGSSFRFFFSGRPSCMDVRIVTAPLDASFLPEPLDLRAGLFDLLDQILFHPLLDENGLLLASYVESEKALQINDVRALKNDPARYAFHRARRIFFRDTPFSFPIYGTEETVAAVTPAALSAYRRSLCDSLTPDCFYVGSEDPAALARDLAGLFSGVPAPAPLPVGAPACLPDRPDGPLRVDETFPAEQSHLHLFFRTETVGRCHPLYPAFAVAVELLGGSPISLLFTHVREKLSLCYSVSAEVWPDFRAVHISCDLLAANRAVAEAAILDQVAAVRAGRFSDAELDAAKKSFSGALDCIADSPADLSAYWLARVRAGAVDPATGLPETPASYAARVRSVTRADVVAALRDLSPDTVYFLQGGDEP